MQYHIVTKIKDTPDESNDKKQLQSFLGILNYGRQFIRDLSKKEKLLLEKLKKYKQFSWTFIDIEIIK